MKSIPSKLKTFCLALFAVAGFWLFAPPTLLAQDNSEKTKKNPSLRWEKAIAEFEEKDRKKPPKKDSVLFLGSSSIRMWKLEKWFSGKGYINRGFGGSEISDSIYYFDRLVSKHRPRTVVFYAGDNDISKGKSPERVAKDFQTFTEKVKTVLPDTRVIFIAIKPSLSRWKLVEKMRKANGLIKEYSVEHPNIEFADIDSPMIGNNQKPREELFAKDGLHLNEAGYKVWYDVIQPLLKKK